MNLRRPILPRGFAPGRALLLALSLASGLGFALALALPQAALARTGSLTLGLATSYDIQSRDYEREEGLDGEIGTAEEDDYQQLGLTPKVTMVSEGAADRIELRLAPTIKYDLDESDTDWDADLFLGGERRLNRNWLLRASNAFLRSDETLEREDDTVAAPADTPTLADDAGRERYWQNTVKLDASRDYGEERQAGLGFDYTVLRNEDQEIDSLTRSSRTEYDRYALRLSHDHRYNAFWKNTARASVVRGEYQEDNDDENPTSTALSDDVWEYRLMAGLENDSFRRQRLLLNYDFTGARYDDDDRSDDDIHALQLQWRHELSRSWSTALGIGPTYYTTGEQEDWGGNGLAELSYRNRIANASLVLDKGYDVDNFSGNAESGLVDYWDLRLKASRQLLETLSADAQLAWRLEQREFRRTSPGDEELDTPQAEDYDEELYTAGAGLSYAFWRDYVTRLGYTYSRQDSDRPGESYDDHRLLLTLSWQQEWLRW